MKVADLQVAMLLYVVGTRSIRVLLLRGKEPVRTFEVGRTSSILGKVDGVVAALAGGFPPTRRDVMLNDFAHEWGPTLLPPEEELVGVDVLVVIPHHFLHGLPLHAVWRHRDGAYLGTVVAVTYSSSATLFLHAMRRNPRRVDASSDVFSLDGPLWRGLRNRARFCVAYGGDVRHGSPQYARLARLFAGHFKGHFLADNPHLSETRQVLKLAGRTDDEDIAHVVCVVCHGFVDEARPELSGLLVSKAAESVGFYFAALDDDKHFQLKDLPYRLPPGGFASEHGVSTEALTALELGVTRAPPTELTCLLGCSTARGAVLPCDDVASLAHQWLKTGSATVLASLWELDVEFAVTWVPKFLHNWTALGQPKAIAHREATRATLRANPDIPIFEWAVLALLGDWL